MGSAASKQSLHSTAPIRATRSLAEVRLPIQCRCRAGTSVSFGVMPSEIGRGASGFTNVLTRSGSDALHGSLFELLGNSSLDARNYFDFSSPASPGRIPPFKRNEFGPTNGGPIVFPHLYNGRRKLYYFGEYQGFRQVLARHRFSRCLLRSSGRAWTRVPSLAILSQYRSTALTQGCSLATRCRTSPVRLYNQITIRALSCQRNFPSRRGRPGSASSWCAK